MNSQSIINDKYIKLAIALKANELKRDQLSSLTYEHVENALLGKWTMCKPASISEAVNDILQLDANEVVAYLSTQAMILGSQMSIHDFEDLFEKQKG